MAEPDRQIEVQLGHLCNNRCVFCVSGQLSEQGRAPQLPAQPIVDQIIAAREGGARKITFLGGEPTIQRSFPQMLRLAVDLGFPEIVIFTNGVMTPRASFRQRVYSVLDELGPDVAKRVIWRFSLQGGDREHHDGTTLNPGSWDRIWSSLEVLHEAGARLTANMCVVESNYRSIVHLADAAKRFGFENIHLDMVRPRDAGDRTVEELRAMMARYGDMAPYFRALVARCDELLGPDFDINLGNLPYCMAPDLAHKIHHDGEATITVAASGQGTTQTGFDKYLDKRVDKEKVEGCRRCVFDGQCSGVFERYGEFFGYDELQPLDAETMWRHDARGDLFALLAKATITRWAEDERVLVGRIDERSGSFDAAIAVDGGVDAVEAATTARWALVLQRAGRGLRRGGWAVLRGERVEAELLGGWPTSAGGAMALIARIDGLDRALGGAGVADPEQVATGLAASWARARREREDAQIVRREQIALAQRLLATLARCRPVGLAAGASHKDAEGEWATMTFRGREGVSLEVDVALLPDADGKARPRLRHRAQGLTEPQLQEASATIGAAIRSAWSAGSRAARTPSPA